MSSSNDDVPAPKRRATGNTRARGNNYDTPALAYGPPTHLTNVAPSAYLTDVSTNVFFPSFIVPETRKIPRDCTESTFLSTKRTLDLPRDTPPAHAAFIETLIADPLKSAFLTLGSKKSVRLTGHFFVSSQQKGANRVAASQVINMLTARKAQYEALTSKADDDRLKALREFHMYNDELDLITASLNTKEDDLRTSECEESKERFLSHALPLLVALKRWGGNCPIMDVRKGLNLMSRADIQNLTQGEAKKVIYTLEHMGFNENEEYRTIRGWLKNDNRFIDTCGIDNIVSAASGRFSGHLQSRIEYYLDFKGRESEDSGRDYEQPQLLLEQEEELVEPESTVCATGAHAQTGGQMVSHGPFYDPPPGDPFWQHMREQLANHDRKRKADPHYGENVADEGEGGDSVQGFDTLENHDQNANQVAAAGFDADANAAFASSRLSEKRPSIPLKSLLK